MAQEIKIPKLVGEDVFANLEKFNKELGASKENYVQYAKELSKGIQIKVDSISSYNAKVDTLSASINKLAETQNKMASLQEQMIAIYNKMNAVLPSIAKAMDSYTSNVRQASEALDKNSKSVTDNAQNIRKASKATSLASDEFNEIVLSIKEYSTNADELNKVLIANNKEINAMKKRVNDLDKEYKAGKITYQSYVDEVSKLTQRQREVASQNQQYTSFLKSHAKVLASTEGSYNQMSAAVSQLEKRFKDLNEEERKGDIGKTLQGQIDKLKTELKSIDAELGNYQRNVGNYPTNGLNDYRDKIQSLLGLNNEFANSLLKSSENGKGFNGVLSDMGTSVSAFGKTLLGLLMNPVFLSIAGLAGAGVAFKFWYDYNKGLVEATKLTKQFTDKSGDDLKKYRDEVIVVSDTFDKDFRETLIATNALSKQFGIDQSEAIELIKDGFISGADANNQFLDIIKEYPAYFREAGISASQFVAIVAQTNKSGIYSDKGIDAIKEGNIRIREMTKATANALDGIGISSKKVQEDLASGATTTFEVMQQVSQKLSELPESSAAVGTAIADIFGGPGEDAGLQYLTTLKDIDTNLDTVKEKAGVLGELQEAQLTSQLKLHEALTRLFDITGGDFERMTTQAKIFVNEGLASIIDGLVEVINYFVRLYNDSVAFRGVISYIELGYKLLWNTVKVLFNYIIDSAKNVAGVVKSAFKFDLKGISDYYGNFIKASKKALADYTKNSTALIIEAGNLNKKLKEIGKEAENPLSNQSTIVNPNVNNDTNKELTEEEKAELEKRKREAERAAKDKLRIQENLNQSMLDLMDEGYKKERKKIELEFEKKINSIRGQSKEEEETRKNLRLQMSKALQEFDDKHKIDVEKTDINNQLASVEKDTKKYLDLRLRMLDLQYKVDVERAEKNGNDINAITAKYDKLKADEKAKYADEEIKKIQEHYAYTAIIVNTAMQDELESLSEQFAKGLITRENYEKEQTKIQQNYAIQRYEDSIALIQDQLDNEDISVEKRKSLEQQLAEAKAKLYEEEKNIAIQTNEEIIKSERKKRQNIQQGLQLLSDAIGALSDLTSNIFEGKIQDLDEQVEKLEETSDAEIAHIEEMEETGAITKEEAEARKRAAEERTATKKKELERQQAELQQRQAKYDKAASVAQTIINTSQAVMKTYAEAGFFGGTVGAAIVAAIGAAQLATIIAQPIPKYAEGTKDKPHKGGLAVVGDGGKSEAIVIGDKIYSTPSIPTLTMLPAGADVFPDIHRLTADDIRKMPISDLRSSMLLSEMKSGKPFIINNNIDISGLRQDMQTNNKLTQQFMVQQRRLANDASFRDYIRRNM